MIAEESGMAPMAAANRFMTIRTIVNFGQNGRVSTVEQFRFGGSVKTRMRPSSTAQTVAYVPRDFQMFISQRSSRKL